MIFSEAAKQLSSQKNEALVSKIQSRIDQINEMNTQVTLGLKACSEDEFSTAIVFFTRALRIDPENKKLMLEFFLEKVNALQTLRSSKATSKIMKDVWIYCRHVTKPCYKKQIVWWI